ncbi:NGG1p interacting factor NIF3 [Moritella sp. Urea-trap-13]|uniref:NGG1p interacting factor NIF3 n=1 Tax=Moritella sp. Urea-trap-13 TaxID=2058327 RepID=UPI000C32BDC9|nr:NGG1p interacting factor NIF3 [Moritella sp. Urea-trap-13]PKH06518.1 NGG1p interacting factor NIF3 [Moritella sp. Urea-trap-13]
MFVIIFYVPQVNTERVKQALFKAGAGTIGDYDSCAWQCLGTGQFKPLQGSQPYIGRLDEITLVDEFRVEMVCPADNLRVAINALIAAHPYEEPAYHILQTFNLDALP